MAALSQSYVLNHFTLSNLVKWVMFLVAKVVFGIDSQTAID